MTLRESSMLGATARNAASEASRRRTACRRFGNRPPTRRPRRPALRLGRDRRGGQREPFLPAWILRPRRRPRIHKAGKHGPRSRGRWHPCARYWSIGGGVGAGGGALEGLIDP